MLPEFLVCCCVLLFGIILKRYDSDSFLRTFYEKHIFLYQRLDSKDAKPSFSVEDPLMAPVMANVALYWGDSSLAWKNSLNALSRIISPQY